MLGGRAVETDRQLQAGHTHAQRVGYVDQQPAGKITRGRQHVAHGVERCRAHDRVGPMDRLRY